MHTSTYESASVRDADLKRWVVRYLFDHKPPLRRIQVEVDNGTVTLRGKVETFYQRQRWINCCRRVAGVIRLIGEIEVAPSPASVPE